MTEKDFGTFQTFRIFSRKTKNACLKEYPTDSRHACITGGVVVGGLTFLSIETEYFAKILDE